MTRKKTKGQENTKEQEKTTDIRRKDRTGQKFQTYR